MEYFLLIASSWSLSLRATVQNTVLSTSAGNLAKTLMSEWNGNDGTLRK
jgi:hypothetical protein